MINKRLLGFVLCSLLSISSVYAMKKKTVDYSVEQDEHEGLKRMILGRTKRYADLGQPYSTISSDQENFVLAIGSGDEPTVHALLEKIEVSQHDFNHGLYYAFWNGKTDMVKFLDQKGLVSIKAFEDHKEVLARRALSECYASLLPYFMNETYDNGKNFILVAIENNNVELVKVLLKNNISLINKSVDFEGRTALHYAVKANQLSLVEFLIQEGAVVDAVDHKGRTALNIAIQKGYYELVEAILGCYHTDFYKKKLVNLTNKMSETPLHQASCLGHVKIAQLLIESGSSVHARDSLGKTPLLRAAENHNVDVVELLLKRGAKVDARSSEGMSGLHWAAMRGNCWLAKLLIDKGADINVQDQMKGRTPLHWAVRMIEGSVIHADTQEEEMRKQNFRLSKEAFLEFISFFVSYSKNARVALNKNIFDNWGLTPFSALATHVDDMDKGSNWYQAAKSLLS